MPAASDVVGVQDVEPKQLAVLGRHATIGLLREERRALRKAELVYLRKRHTIPHDLVPGGDVNAPLITNAEITKSNYMDVVVPTIASIEPGVSTSQNDVTFTCDKVEFAEAETRVYLTVANDRSDTVSYGVYEIRIIKDGQQIEQDSTSSSSYDGNYPELSYDLSAGATTSGILVFPAIEPGTAFKLVIPNLWCDDYEVEFSDAELEIPAE